MKKIRLLILTVVATGLSQANAQFSIGFHSLGYGFGKINLSPFTYEYVPNTLYGIDETENYTIDESSLTFHRITYTIGGVSKNLIVEGSTSFSPRVNKKINGLNHAFEMRSRFTEWLKMYFSFGGNLVGDKLRGYGGFQFFYEHFESFAENEVHLPYKSINTNSIGYYGDKFYVNEFIGNNYGLNANLVYGPTDNLGIRLAFNYNWLNSKGLGPKRQLHLKGKSLNPEFHVYYKVDNVGLKASYRMHFRTLNNAGDEDYIPSLKANSSEFNFSIVFLMGK